MSDENNLLALPEAQAARDAAIVRASVVGIAANLVLAALKALFGLVVNSMAMVLDAVNSLSDALSSTLTIIGTRLAAKKPDKRHPLGYGRVEHLTSMSIAMLILYAGLTSLKESVKGILQPEAPNYSPAALIAIAVSIATKLLLSRHFRRVGKRTNSASLTATAKDAFFDMLLSTAVLASAALFLLSGLNVEAWVGAVISLFILKSGIEILRESTDEVLGRRFDPELIGSIRKTICEDEAVLGAYDLILHSYGPERLLGSVHVEVSSAMTADELDRMERRITARVYERHGVLLTGIGIYSDYQGASSMRDKILDLVRRHDGVLQIHGFFADEAQKQAGFDLVLDYERKDRQKIYQAVCEEVGAAFPDYKIQITVDIDF